MSDQQGQSSVPIHIAHCHWLRRGESALHARAAVGCLTDSPRRSHFDSEAPLTSRVCNSEPAGTAGHQGRVQSSRGIHFRSRAPESPAATALSSAVIYQLSTGSTSSYFDSTFVVGPLLNPHGRRNQVLIRSRGGSANQGMVASPFIIYCSPSINMDPFDQIR